MNWVHVHLNVFRFFKRLVHFYKPTNHRFSRLEVNHKQGQKMVHCGCLLVDFLLSTDQVSSTVTHHWSGQFYSDTPLIRSVLQRHTTDQVSSTATHHWPGTTIRWKWQVTSSHHHDLVFVYWYLQCSRGENILNFQGSPHCQMLH